MKIPRTERGLLTHDVELMNKFIREFRGIKYTNKELTNLDRTAKQTALDYNRGIDQCLRMLRFVVSNSERER